MKAEDIKNVAVFLNVSGRTLAIDIPAEMKRAVGLFAINAATGDRPVNLIPVPHMSLPADPEVKP